MVFHALTSTASRGLKQAATKVAARRSMGTAVKKEWTGIDAVARKYFPEDYQLAGAILSFYGALIGIAVIRSKLKSVPEPEAPAPAPDDNCGDSCGVKGFKMCPYCGKVTDTSTAPSSDVLPAPDSPEFEKFIESDAFEKFIESEDSLMKWVESLGKE